MKKIILSLIISSFVFCLSFAVFSPAQASGLGDAFSKKTLSAVAGNNYNQETDIYAIIGLIVQTLLGLLGVIFISLLVYGGVLWMTSEGDKSKVEKAQGIIRNATIGLIIVVSAYAISYFVITALSKSTLGK